MNDNVTKTLLVISKGKFGDIDTKDTSCNDYYIILFTSTQYNHQYYFNIDERVISSGEIMREDTYSPPRNINLNQNISSNQKKTAHFFL